MADCKAWEDVIRRDAGDKPRLLAELIPEGGMFYDIGANVGAMTDMVLGINPNINCVLFEPVKEYYNYITEKYKDNPRITTINCAVVDTDREVEISVDGTNFGWNTLSEIHNYGSKEIIQGRSLSSIVKELDLVYPDVIKVDVEQSEYLVIEGAKDLLTTHHPIGIMIEIGIHREHRFWEKEEQMIQYLFSLGYGEYDYKSYNNTYDVIFRK